MSVTGRALWFIESHLDADLSLDRIADAIAVSPFHLSRAFVATTGAGLTAYVRGRRLSRAAQALAAGAPDILAVALDAGYGSHEAFTRAFKQQFDVTPESVRARGPLHHLSLTEPLRMNPTHPASLPAPRIETRDAFLVFGLGEHYRRSNAGIPAQWGRFVAHLDHIPTQMGHVTYGVIHNADAAGNFDYICAVEVAEFPAEPATFTRLRIPSHTYAVFHHQGHISSIAATMTAIWERGLAEAHVQPVDGPVFERYDERFNPATGLGGLEIWVPIKE